MKLFLAIAILSCPATVQGWPALFATDSPQTPHPAVVRIIAPEKDGVSMGSGSLVAVNARHGLVVTNWHVVRDATGPISVMFSDGFSSGAVVLRTDHDWDLAALAIHRPEVQPIKLSLEPPRRGEPLTIAGYGPGNYRAATGTCTQYLSPGKNLPYELVELSVAARHGDSGGPILNSQGEIAGVLFGADGSTTTGSFCGRVRPFLAAAYVDMDRLTGSPALIAKSASPENRPPAASIAAVAPSPQPQNRVSAPIGRVEVPPTREIRAEVPVAIAPGTVEPAGPTRGDQIKSILAVIGVIAILFHGIRLLGAAAG